VTVDGGGAAEDYSVGQVATRRVYAGRVISLDLDVVRYPDGSVGELEMVRHPGASAIVPFVSAVDGVDPQILLLKQYRYAAGTYLYEVPAGRLNPGEDPADCAERELREETGCSAERIEFLFTMFTTPGFTDERIHVFTATGLVRGEPTHEADEFMTVESVSLSSALEMIRVGKINDAKTALAILYAAGFCAGR
jgi:ADP-ribose diphosphatase